MTGRRQFIRHRHDDATRYVIYVLWLQGFRLRDIAPAAKLRNTQVAGIIDSSIEYRNRAAMTDAERAAKLSELERIRIGEDGRKLDGGVLDRVGFQCRPLGPGQRRRV